jgi:hypothetical protein
LPPALLTKIVEPSKSPRWIQDEEGRSVQETLSTLSSILTTINETCVLEHSAEGRVQMEPKSAEKSWDSGM